MQTIHMIMGNLEDTDKREGGNLFPGLETNIYFGMIYFKR